MKTGLVKTGLVKIGILAAFACVLNGCGQKGPLYLPDKTGEVATRPSKLPPEPSIGPVDTPSIDTPAESANPAPEVTVPAPDPAKPDPDKKDAKADDKDAAKPPL